MDPRKTRILVCAIIAASMAGNALHSALRWSQASRVGWSGASFRTVTAPGRPPRLVVDRTQPRSPAARAGLRPGDRIIEINGRRENLTETSLQLRPGDSVRYKIARGPRRESEVTEVSVTLVNPLRQPSIVMSIAVDFATALVFLIIGCFVYWLRPSDARARVFLVLCASFALARFLSLGPTYVYPFSLAENLVGITLMAGLALLFFPALLHFCLIFPKQRPALTRYPNLLKSIYGTTAGLTAIVAAALTAEVLAQFPLHIMFQRRALPRPWMEALGAAERHAAVVLTPVALLLGFIAYRLVKRLSPVIRSQGWKGALIGRAGLTFATTLTTASAVCAAAEVVVSSTGLTAFRGVPFVAFILAIAAHVGAMVFAESVVFPIAACVALYRSYRESGPEDRPKLRWPVWGILTAVSLYLLAPRVIDLVDWLFRIDRQSLYFAGVFFFREHGRTALLVLIPLSMAFAILKHRLMDIELYMRRTATYGLLSALLGLVFLVLTAGLARLLSAVSGARNEWAPIFATVIVAAVVVPLRNRVQSLVDGRFFRGKPNYFEALRQLTADLSRERDRNAMLRSAAEGMRSALGSRFAVFFIRSSDDRSYRAAVHVGEPAKAADILITPSWRALESLAGAVAPFETNLPSDVQQELAAMGCALLAPARVGERVFGFVAFGRRSWDEAYDMRDREFVAAAADQAALQLERFRVEDEQREYHTAREIQEALLPKDIPHPPGIEISAVWKPARVVGGDYYDVLDLGAGRYAFAIGDVSGKGLPAALLMSNLQAAVRAIAHEAHSPASLCAGVNRIVCGHVLAARFITFFYAIFDARTLELTYSNAGHNAPVLRRPDGREIRLEAGGIVLGVSPRATYEQETISIESGDRLLLFTDGLTEAFNEHDEEFGEERLRGILETMPSTGANELQTAIVSAVSEFCHGNFNDDATLIVVAFGTPAAALSPSTQPASEESVHNLREGF
jgi:serine phosphatase RsbU (regulator of sigma subunit)